MAGIGFELRKVIGKGRLTNIFNAALSGILIVAGPWLLTIVTIFLIRQSFSAIGLSHQGLFQAGVIYSYAFSLSLFSAVHFLFTRLTSDLIWEKKEREASAWLLLFCVGVAVLASLVAGVPLGVLPLPGLENPELFKWALVLLFVAVNLLWVVMLFVSILKQYVKILAVYVVGMASAVGFVFWGGKWLGVAGSVFGFAAGHLIIVAALLFLCLREFPPIWPSGRQWMRVFSYARKFALLIGSGLFFYLGQWIDKVVFWFSRGVGVEGSFFRIFDTYDFPVYLAGLTIIPGLVYFVIFTETTFYSSLSKFLNSLLTQPYNIILQMRFNLIRSMNQELRDQTLFQAVVTGMAGLAAWWWLPGVNLTIVLLAMVGAFFQLMLMTLLNFLYYFELFRYAFYGALAFLVGQVLFSWLGVVWLGLVPGVGFLVSAAVACVVCMALLRKAGRSLDRRIFSKAVG